jgi:Raf kinase inhibitor-like YbhB/YbcL family protein
MRQLTVIWLISLTFILFTGGMAMAFELKSQAFSPKGTIPQKYTCDREDVSVPLTWSDSPAGTKAFALIADDPDAPVGTWVHWVLYNLPGDVTELPEGVPPTKTIPQGASQGTNDFRKIGYGGPCPPPGKPHRYFFKLYALSDKVNLPPGATKAQLLNVIEGHILGQAQLMGTYGR